MALGVTASLQVLVVAISGSVALLADTIHNFSDALTAVPLWIAFVLSRRAASRRHTYGYGRVEDLAGLFIVGMIALSAVIAGWEAIDRLLHPAPVSNLGWVAAAGIIGFAGNELVAVYRMRVGRRIGSAALVADGLHARTDGLTSLAVVAGAAGVALGWQAADPVIGLLITVVILAVLCAAARDVFSRLLDGGRPINRRRRRGIATRHAGCAGRARRAVALVRSHAARRGGCRGGSRPHRPQAHDEAHDAQGRLATGVRRLSAATIHISPTGAHPATSSVGDRHAPHS